MLKSHDQRQRQGDQHLKHRAAFAWNSLTEDYNGNTQAFKVKVNSETLKIDRISFEKVFKLFGHLFDENSRINYLNFLR